MNDHMICSINWTFRDLGNLYGQKFKYGTHLSLLNGQNFNNLVVLTVPNSARSHRLFVDTYLIRGLDCHDVCI